MWQKKRDEINAIGKRLDEKSSYRKTSGSFLVVENALEKFSMRELSCLKVIIMTMEDKPNAV